MKVLVFSNRASNLIGFRYELLKSLVKSGIEVCTVAPPDIKSISEKMSEIGVRYIPLDYSKSSINPFKELGVIFSIMSIIKREAPDVMFSFMTKPVIYGSIAAKLCGVKHIQSMIEGLGYMFVGRTRKQRILKYVALILYWIALKCTDRVYFLNNDDKQYFEKYIVSPKKTKRIFGIGINLEKFSPFKQNKDNLMFLFVGRLLIDKGVKEFIEAAKIVSAKYTQARFVIVGGADENPASLSSEEIAEYSKITAIKFVGVQSDVRPYLMECSALVLPSGYREGMPMSLMEAMASSRAVIATDVPGCRDLIIRKSPNDTLANGVLEGKNGYMIEKGNVQAITKAMIDLIENPHKIEAMGKEGRKFAEQFFDCNKINKILIGDIMAMAEERKKA